MSLVMLRHDGEHPQVGRRFEIVSELVRPFVAEVIEVRAQGEGDLAQLFDLTYFGDYVSLWMAADAGVDPGPIDVLMWLKSQLAGSGGSRPV
jgi:glucose/mannose-6-phosphate isomerase